MLQDLGAGPLQRSGREVGLGLLETTDIWTEGSGFFDPKAGLDRGSRQGTVTAAKIGTDIFLIQNDTNFFPNVNGAVHVQLKLLLRLPDSNTCQFVSFVSIFRFPQGADHSKSRDLTCRVVR